MFIIALLTRVRLTQYSLAGWGYDYPDANIYQNDQIIRLGYVHLTINFISKNQTIYLYMTKNQINPNGPTQGNAHLIMSYDITKVRICS